MHKNTMYIHQIYTCDKLPLSSLPTTYNSVQENRLNIIITIIKIWNKVFMNDSI